MAAEEAQGPNRSARPVVRAEYANTAVNLDGLPPMKWPEYAFVGRSNVGKSSFINYLTNRKDLARTSATPGKTRAIHHFLVDDTWYLVDLPGYGYAKLPKKERDAFGRMLNTYLQKRANLMTIFLLVDSRIPPQQLDLDFLHNATDAGLPVAIVFTKADKPDAPGALDNVNAFLDALRESWEELPPHWVTSAEKRQGAEGVLTYIRRTNPLFDPKALAHLR